MQPDQMNVYIAAPFFNNDQLRVVKNIELELDIANIKYYSPRSEGILKDMTPEQRKERMSYLFQQNVKHLNLCSHLLAVIDNYDTGTVWEMGYAYAKGSEILTYTNYHHGINVMLNESIIGHCMEIWQIVPALNGNIDLVKGSDVI